MIRDRYSNKLLNTFVSPMVRRKNAQKHYGMIDFMTEEQAEKHTINKRLAGHKVKKRKTKVYFYA